MGQGRDAGDLRRGLPNLRLNGKVLPHSTPKLPDEHHSPKNVIFNSLAALSAPDGRPAGKLS